MSHLSETLVCKNMDVAEIVKKQCVKCMVTVEIMMTFSNLHCNISKENRTILKYSRTSII